MQYTVLVLVLVLIALKVLVLVLKDEWAVLVPRLLTPCYAKMSGATVIMLLLLAEKNVPIKESNVPGLIQNGLSFGFI